MKDKIIAIIFFIALILGIFFSYRYGYEKGKYAERERWLPIFDRMITNSIEEKDKCDTCVYQLKDCWQFVNERVIK